MPDDDWDGPLLPLEDIDFADMIDHGTGRGYQQHRRYGIPTCDACLIAKRDETRRSRERQQNG